MERLQNLSRYCDELDKLLASTEARLYQLNKIKELVKKVSELTSSKERIPADLLDRAESLLAEFYRMQDDYAKVRELFFGIIKRSKDSGRKLAEIDALLSLSSIYLGQACLVSETESTTLSEISTWLDRVKELIDLQKRDMRVARYYVLLSYYYLYEGKSSEATRFWYKWQKIYGDLGESYQILIDNLIYHRIFDKVSVGGVFIDKKTPDNLLQYLKNLGQLNLSTLESRFGEYLTNDREFLESVNKNIINLRNKLEKKLDKPEVILLRGEPGSGKTFFISQYIEELKKHPVANEKDSKLSDATLVSKNVSAYQNVNDAFNDIILSTLIALAKHTTVVLFIDEVDTKLADGYLISRLIAPIYGQDFYFSGHCVTFANQQLICFLASSLTDETFQEIHKAQDFISRIPQYNRIDLPSINASYMERIYRAVGILVNISKEISTIEIPALIYIGLREWESTRELELLLRHVVGSMPLGNTTVKLFDLPITASEFEEFHSRHKLDLLSIEEDVLTIK